MPTATARSTQHGCRVQDSSLLEKNRNKILEKMRIEGERHGGQKSTHNLCINASASVHQIIRDY